MIEESLDGALSLLGFVEHLTGNQSNAYGLLFEKQERVYQRMLASKLKTLDGAERIEVVRLPPGSAFSAETVVPPQ